MIIEISSFLMGFLQNQLSQVNTLYVRHRLHGEAFDLTVAASLISLPWSVKLIYGIIADKYKFRSRSYLEYMRILPIIGAHLFLLPLATRLNKGMYCAFLLLVSLSMAFFQSTLFAYTAFSSQLPGAEKGLLDKGLYFGNLGRLASSALYIATTFLLAANPGLAISVTYFFLFSVEILLTLICNCSSTTEEPPKKQKDQSSLLKAVSLFLKNRKIQKLVLYTFFVNAVPTLDPYVIFFLTDPVEKEGVGMSFATLAFLNLFVYGGAAFGGYLLNRLAHEKTLRKLSDSLVSVVRPEDSSSSSQTGGGNIPVRFVVSHAIYLLFYLGSAIFFHVSCKDKLPVFLCMAFGNFLSGISMNFTVSGGQKIIVTEAPSGYEGTFTTFYFSFYNLSGLLSGYSGVFVYELCNKQLLSRLHEHLTYPYLLSGLVLLSIFPLAFFID